MAKTQTRRKMKRLRNRNKKSLKRGGFLENLLPNRCAGCIAGTHKIGCSLCSNAPQYMLGKTMNQFSSNASNTLSSSPQQSSAYYPNGVGPNVGLNNQTQNQSSIFGSLKSLFGTNSSNPITPQTSTFPSGVNTPPTLNQSTPGYAALGNFYGNLGNNNLISQPLANNQELMPLTSSAKVNNPTSYSVSNTQQPISANPFSQQLTFNNPNIQSPSSSSLATTYNTNSNAFTKTPVNPQNYGLYDGGKRKKTQRGGYRAYTRLENVATYAAPFRGDITAQPQVWVGGKTKKKRYNRKHRK